jgi:hypothetical protein
MSLRQSMMNKSIHNKKSMTSNNQQAAVIEETKSEGYDSDEHEHHQLSKSSIWT